MTKALDVLLNGFADIVADRVVEKITVGEIKSTVEEEIVQPAVEEPKQEEKLRKITLEEIRTKCVGLTRTHRKEIKETLEKFGVSKLTSLKEADYVAFFEEISDLEG